MRSQQSSFFAAVALSTLAVLFATRPSVGIGQHVESVTTVLAGVRVAEPSAPVVTPAESMSEPGALGSASPDPTSPSPAIESPTTTAPPALACRAAVLVHGGAYYAGHARDMATAYRSRLEVAGWNVWATDYPLLAASTDIVLDQSDSWYPRSDIYHTPPQMRVVHDRATAAVAVDVRSALATGCAVTLVGYSAGGSIVLDLATKFSVNSVVVVSSSTITPELVPLSPIQMFYGGLDPIIQPSTVQATCDLWLAVGRPCDLHLEPKESHTSELLAREAVDWMVSL